MAVDTRDYWWDDLNERIIMSDASELKTARWLAGGNMAERISQFVEAVVQHYYRRVESIVWLAARHAQLFVTTQEE